MSRADVSKLQHQVQLTSVTTAEVILPWSHLEYEDDGVRAARAPLPEADCTHTLLEIASRAE
jgi:hypothetical protein